MKTPREILLERHRHAEPALDAVRHNVLTTLFRTRTKNADCGTGAAEPGVGRPARQVRAVLRRAWLELIWPSRRAWAGIAALWLAVLAANLQLTVTRPPAQALRSAPAREIARAFQERQRLLAELLPPTGPRAVQPVHPRASPRGERPVPFKACCTRCINRNTLQKFQTRTA